MGILPLSSQYIPPLEPGPKLMPLMPPSPQRLNHFRGCGSTGATISEGSYETLEPVSRPGVTMTTSHV